MKAQMFLAVSLVGASLPLIAKPMPPWDLTQANSTSVEKEATLVSSPSPFEEETDATVSCATPAVPFKADANETSPEIPEQYARAQRLIMEGAWKRARLVLERGIEQFPESRHLRMLYADLLWYLSRGGKDQALLEQSAEQAVKAMEIGLGFDIVDYGLIDRLTQTLSRTGDADNFERLFARSFALDPGPFTHRYYALGLSRMKSPHTEEAFKAAVALEAEGDSHADYGEWLLDQQRYADALDMLPRSPKHIYYLNFLRGLALERTDRPGQARKSYDAFRDFSVSFPAPARFRIEGSKIQRDSGIRFDDDHGRRTTGTGDITNIADPLNDQQGIDGLSYMIWGEARGEGYGGMLAVGWVARARVLRGTVEVPSPCPYVVRSGSTLADWYKSVICQSGAFYGACSAWCSNPATTSCTSNPTTDSAAYDVFYGLKPDPVSGHCPGGVATAGNNCTGTTTCVGSPHTYKLSSPLFQLAVAPGAACTGTCAPNSYGQICGNGGATDHCFYGNSSCAGTKRYGYEGTITTVGGAFVTAAYNVTSSGAVHKAHLQGPETGVNFNINLQYSSTGAAPWTDLTGSNQPHSVEDVETTTTATGYYRWRIVSVTGTGYWFACTKRP